jgi:hypothetical protein
MPTTRIEKILVGSVVIIATIEARTWMPSSSALWTT